MYIQKSYNTYGSITQSITWVFFELVSDPGHHPVLHGPDLGLGQNYQCIGLYAFGESHNYKSICPFNDVLSLL